MVCLSLFSLRAVSTGPAMRCITAIESARSSAPDPSGGAVRLWDNTESAQKNAANSPHLAAPKPTVLTEVPAKSRYRVHPADPARSSFCTYPVLLEAAGLTPSFFAKLSLCPVQDALL